MALNLSQGIRSLNTTGMTGADALASDIEGTNQFGRGWSSAGLSSRAGELWDQSLKAQIDGRTDEQAVLEQQARDLQGEAAQWAPRVQDVSEVRNLRDGLDWVGGAMGNMRTSVAPAVAGLAGGALGMVAAPLTGGIVNPATLGFAAASAAGYGLEQEEAVASAMNDPYIRANHTPEEILAASRVKGGINAMLEAAVPAVMGGKILGTGVKPIIDAGWKGAAKQIGKTVLEAAPSEFATEGTQSLVGQGTQNYLQDKPITDFDYKQALNEGAAGAVAGGGMGVIGGVADVAHNTLDAGVDKAKDVAANPSRTLGDLIADGGAMGGKVVGKGMNFLDRMSSSPHRAFDSLVGPSAGKADDVLSGQAMEWASHVMNDKGSTEQEKADAKDFVLRAAQGDTSAWSAYRDKLTIEHHESKNAEADLDIAAETSGKSKKSLMRGVLTDDFGEQEGRDRSDDRVTDDFGDLARTPQMSARDAASQAEASQIGQPVLPRQNLKLKDAPRAQLETTADIWRKQGVAEKLLQATSDKTDTAQRQMAIGVLGWVSRGFKDVDGNVFVPESLVKQYKDKAPKMIQSAAKLAFEQGLIGHDEARMTPEVMQMATMQHADATAVRDSVIGAIPEYARDKYAPHAAEITTMLRKAVNEGTNKKQEEALLSIFGSKEAIAQAMSKLPEPKNKAHSFDKETAKKGSVDEDGNTVDEDGNVIYTGEEGSEQEFETGMSTKELGVKSSVRGHNRENDPYDVQDPSHKERLAERVGEAKDGEARKAVGVWDRVVEMADGDRELQHEAETALLDQYGEQYLSDAHKKAMEEYGVSASTAINEAQPEVRRAILSKINRRYQLVRTEASAPAAAADAISKDKVGSFAERDLDVRGPAALIDKGVLFLDRDGVKTPFVTSAMRLLKHAWASKKVERNSTQEGVGVHGTYQDMLATVAALMEADPRFNGRIGYKTEVGGEIKWLPKGGKLPADFKLPKGATIGMAETQATRSLKAGDKESSTVRFATTSRDMFKALRELADKETTSPKWSRFITKSLVQKPKETRAAFEKRITSLYRSYRGDDSFEMDDGQTHGNVTGRGEDTRDLVPSEVTTDESVQGTTRAEDPRVKDGDGVIHRDSRGVALGAEDASAGVGGHAARSEAASHSADGPQPVVKREKNRDDRAAKVVDARDWAFDILNKKGVPAYVVAFNKLGTQKETVGKSQTALLGLKVLARMTPQEVQSEIDQHMSLDDAAKMVVKANNALNIVSGKVNVSELVEASNGNLDEGRSSGVQSAEGASTSNRGRSDAVDGPEGAVRGERSDKDGGAPATKLGKGEVNAATSQQRLQRPLEANDRGSSGRDSAPGHQGRGERSSSEGSLGLGGILSTTQLDTAIYDESYGALDTVSKLMQLAHHVSQRDKELSARDAAGEELSKRDEGIWSLASQLVFDARKWLKNPNSFTGADFESFFDGVEHTDADVESFAKALAGVKQSTQTADITGKRASPEAVEAARKHILDTLGTSVKASFVKAFADNSSGSWTPGATINAIRVALNSDVLGTTYHESMHEFFSQLGKAGSSATQELLKRVATNPILNRKIELLLKDHPEAAAQVRSDPEEAVAFMYQFWQAGLLKLGPETQTFFEKIKSFFASLFGKVSAEVRDAQHAEEVLAAFSGGVLKEDATRDAVLKVLNQNTEAHDAALERADRSALGLINAFGKLVMSSEAMMKATKNAHMISIANDFNQESGDAKGEKQDLFNATKQQMNIWTNRLDNILTAYKAEDLELARHALATGVPAKDRVAKEIVAKIEAFNEQMFQYITSRGVSRWDDETHKWVPVAHRKDYFRRVWNTDAVRDNAEKFRSLLLSEYPKQLQSIADQANAEVKAGTYVQGTASEAQLAKSPGDRQTITPDMVADAIVLRLLNANGQIELAESTASIGMSPVATSVNRRSLSWIEGEKFDEFLSKDITNIMTGYVSSMVKRAEHTKVFGNGAEKLKTKADSAVLHELGGKKLVDEAGLALPLIIKAWRKRAAAARAAGLPFDEPYPTLRQVGQELHFAQVGKDKGLENLAKATKTLEQGFRAVMAMEGTLGADITPGLRAANSALMTYQTFRLLPLVLFSSINDVMGITANDGGTLNDAWHAFVSGMKEIKLRWSDEKSRDASATRAEEWGTVDAGSFSDTLGQTYGSMYMTGKARRLSNSFFKWNGMEGWNRGVRVYATSVAERAIKAYKTSGIDKSDKAVVARSEALFGKDFDHSTIALDADGNLDVNDPVNQAAVMRWVTNAIMSPNAAHRTIWGSDTRLASFWMLKQFAYTFHRVMLKNAVAQAKLGNYRPAMVLALGYAPVAIAADAVKELLVPGDDPTWMKMGLGEYLRHGVDGSGILGVPGMVYDSVTYDYGVGLLGPSLSQVAKVPFDSTAESALGALPFGGRLKKLVPEEGR